MSEVIWHSLSNEFDHDGDDDRKTSSFFSYILLFSCILSLFTYCFLLWRVGSLRPCLTGLLANWYSGVVLVPASLSHFLSLP